ncbi:MAG TPA: bifunctional phosphoglucose/phosphomannose isomerase [Acidimicrobiales bacterium]|nr:bifunctional phosphoglucose/phosphomannose isomerase [Acidimicrobiales bacterium]
MEAPAGVLDTEGMFDATAGLPEQIEAAVEAALGVAASAGLTDAPAMENVVVMGMGGSGIAGDVLVAAATPLLPVSVSVVKSYECPAFVGDGSLVFAISASGDTEETLQAVSDAALQGAKVVAITSGGELARLAAGWDAPVIPVPANLPQPRTALGAMAIPPLIVLEEIGLFRGARSWIGLAIDQLKRRRDRLVAGGDRSEAAAMARRIGRTWPLIHGGGVIGATAAQRWKTQVNENAKAPAFWSAQPELCHNEVCGWGQHGDVTRQIITLVELRHDGEHPQVSRRFELVEDLVREVVAGIIPVRAEGDGDLAQLFDLILMGDFVSLWLAAQEGIDPGPVPALVDLKRKLASSS